MQKLTIIALVALVGAVLVLPAWDANGGAPHAPIVQLGLVALLVATLHRNGEQGGSRRRSAHEWEEECARLLAQNTDLRRQIDESQRRLVETNDMVLRRVGVELHDGPAQLISFALLRLDGLRPDGTTPSGSAAPGDLERIRGALQEALAEIRSVAAGLTLPELGCVSPADVLRLAVRKHERRTATTVACEVEELPEHLPAAFKSCLYRFAQEGLNNAYQHAGGCGQAVRAKLQGDTIEVEVADAGPGFQPDSKIAGTRLGLVGMRQRVTSLGGTLEIDSWPGSGTRLKTRFRVVSCGPSQA